MNKTNKNQNGFTFIEALLIILILVVIGAVGYMVYHNNQQTKSKSVSSSTSSTSSGTSSNSTDSAYAGWKTYCSTYEQSCFKYPSTWTLANACTDAGVCEGFDAVTVSSPNNSDVSFTSAVNGRGGDCGQGAKDSFITSVSPLPNDNSLYLVQFSRADISTIDFGVDDTTNDSKPVVGDTGSCFTYTQFNAVNTPQAQASLFGSVPKSASSKDLSTALKIIDSYYYQQ